MFSKYLMGFIGVGALAGGAAVTAISWKSSDSNKEKETTLKNHQEKAPPKTPAQKESEKLGFSGKLLFPKTIKILLFQVNLKMFFIKQSF